MKDFLRQLNPAVPAIVWSVVILVLCSIPGEDIPEIEIIGVDKVVHFAMFATLGVLWMRVPNKKNLSTGLMVILGGILFGIATEFYQEWLDWGRLMDPFDALANSIGILLAVPFMARLDRKRHSSA